MRTPHSSITTHVLTGSLYQDLFIEFVHFLEIFGETSVPIFSSTLPDYNFPCPHIFLVHYGQIGPSLPTFFSKITILGEQSLSWAFWHSQDLTL